MIKLSDIHDGMMVKVVSVPDDSPDYTLCLNKFGVIDGEPYGYLNDEEPEWVFVLLDGDKIPCEFKLSELEALDKVLIFEGIAKKYANGVFVDDLWSGAIPGVEFQPGEEIRVTVTVSKSPHKPIDNGTM